MKLKNLNTIFIAIALVISNATCTKENDVSNISGSKNGSLTRFITVNNFLYLIDNSNLISYNISTAGQPVFSNKQNVGFNIETIFYTDNKLFIGSSNAMFIYGVTNPAVPNKISETTYRTIGRDPIIVIDTIAYSTLRNQAFGTNVINGGILNIYNIKNAAQPMLANSLTLRNPYGLDAYQNALYICDGAAGLAVYNKTNITAPVLINYITSTETFYDAIVEGQTLIAYIKGGVAFYNISTPLNPLLLQIFKN